MSKLSESKGPHGSEKGRPSVEEEMPGLHHEIVFIILPESAAEEKRQRDVFNTVLLTISYVN